MEDEEIADGDCQEEGESDEEDDDAGKELKGGLWSAEGEEGRDLGSWEKVSGGVRRWGAG